MNKDSPCKELICRCTSKVGWEVFVYQAVRVQSERNGPGVLTHPGFESLRAPGEDLPLLPPQSSKADIDLLSWPLCWENPGHPATFPPG